MTYGYAVKPENRDALVDLIEKMMTEFSLAAVPFAWLVDLVPILQHLPEYFPGPKFKKIARKWRESIHASAYIPYRFVQGQIAADNYRPSYVSKLIRQCKQDGPDNTTLNRDDEEAIIWTAASLYGAAADTTVITLTTFTLAMVLFPEVQIRAQKEIDSELGSKRLPSFEDRHRLPYVDAMVKETLRWWPIAPMGFPHTADEDIQYNNTHIPKGAYLLPAVWWFLHDPAVYAEPEKFDPERFLSPRNEPDPGLQAFGYARRICPGRFFADASLYLNIVKCLAAFNIKRALDRNGEEIAVDVKPKPGILSYPTEFQFKVLPRSQAHVDLIRRIEAEVSRDEGDAELLETMDDWRKGNKLQEI
jgi:cytochrome P450